MSNTLSPPLYSQAPDEESLKPSTCPLKFVFPSAPAKKEMEKYETERTEELPSC